MPKYKQVQDDVAKLRELADFLEKNGVAMPDYWLSHSTHISLTETNYGRGDNDEWETTIDEDGTKRNIKKFLDAVGPCEKDYREDRLQITTTYKHDGSRMFTGMVDRSIACKKVVKGKKFIKEHLVPSRFEEEVEWVCDENLSLKKLVQGVK